MVLVRFRWALMPLALAMLMVACARSSQPAAPTSQLTSQAGQPGKLTPILPASDLAVGTDQRFLLALIGPDNRVVTDANVELAFFKVTGPSLAQLRSRATATFYESPGLATIGRGVYVARTDFDEAGEWGVAAVVQMPSAEPAQVRLSFQVKPKSSTPTVGDPVPASRTATGLTPSEVEKFCSSRPGDEFHRVSIADALAQRKPLVVLFATPGFCESRVCGPSLDVLKTLHGRYGERVSFVHVETYKDGRPNEQREMVPAVTEWGLPSEAWLFVVGADGRLVEKLEGSITVEEASPVLDRVLGT